VYIDANNNRQLDIGESFTISDSRGAFILGILPEGTYIIRQILPVDWIQTTPTNGFGIHLTLSGGQDSINNNFGSRLPSFGTASIAGNVFDDFNHNGIKDSDDVGLEGWRVYLDLNNNGILDTYEQRVLTDSAGNYIISNLAVGYYKMRIVLEAGYVQTTPANGFGNNATLASGQHATGENFGADS
jgi:serine-aspartate repeat-containing protein C/D/E